MESKIKISPDISKCVGLWLAEGDTKTKREITFTNNCNLLIEFFSTTIENIFRNYRFHPRIYIYSKYKEKVTLNLNCIKTILPENKKNPLRTEAIYISVENSVKRCMVH